MPKEDPYILQDRFATGSVAEVYQAQVRTTGDLVVVKVLRPELTEDASVVARFLDETRACEGVEHPNVVRHLGSGRLADGRVYVATEYLDGEDLASRLDNLGPLTPDEWLALLGPLASALDALHERGIVHRDLKPDNIFLAGGLEANCPKLIDFGLALFRGDRKVQTQKGVLLTPPEYISPECIEGARADAMSDLYALGVLTYEVLTGSPPFTASTYGDLLLQHLHTAPPSLTGECAPLSKPVRKCLAKKPAERFPSATAFHQALVEAWRVRARPATPTVSGRPNPQARAKSDAPALSTSNGAVKTEAVEIPESEVDSTQPMRVSSVDKLSKKSQKEVKRDDEVGEIFGHYRVIKLLGEGGMGKVYQAKHMTLGRQVAIKVLLPESARNQDTVQRFFQEAQTVNQINHENIVEIFDFVAEELRDGTPRAYCVMELLEGHNLADMLEQTPLPVVRVLSIGKQVASALAAAHKVGVVHRDIKPDNVFVLSRPGRPDFVKLLDFGVAKLTQPLTSVVPGPKTIEGAIIGTPMYMAPEQASGDRVDERSDIYSLGVMLYQLLSGRLPFDAKTFGQLVAKIMTEQVPSLPSNTAGGEPIPKELSEFVLRCLTKAPRERPQTMVEVAATLSDFVTAAEREPLRVDRGPVRWLVPAGIGLALVGVLGVVLWPSHPATSSDSTKPAASTVPPIPVPVPVAVAAASVADEVTLPSHSSAPTPWSGSQSKEVPVEPAKIKLQIASSPPGAKVTQLDTGEILGRTPFRFEVPKREGTMKLRFESEGEAIVREVHTTEDVVLDVVFAPAAAAQSANKANSSKTKQKRKNTKSSTTPSEDATIDPFSE